MATLAIRSGLASTDSCASLSLSSATSSRILSATARLRSILATTRSSLASQPSSCRTSCGVSLAVSTGHGEISGGGGGTFSFSFSSSSFFSSTFSCWEDWPSSPSARGAAGGFC